jgi:hypothetical protein
MHWSDPITVSEKKEGKGKHQQLTTCALDYHNEYFFGLAKYDAALVSTKRSGVCLQIRLGKTMQITLGG